MVEDVALQEELLFQQYEETHDEIGFDANELFDFGNVVEHESCGWGHENVTQNIQNYAREQGPEHDEPEVETTADKEKQQEFDKSGTEPGPPDPGVPGVEV